MFRICLAKPRAYIDTIAEYFRDGRCDIAESNLRMLKTVTASTLTVSLLFFVISPYLVSNWKITIEYWMLVPLTLVFLAFAVLYDRRKEKNIRLIQGMIIAFNVLLLLVFTAISVFPYPETSELYVGVWLIIMPVMFVLPFSVQLTVSFCTSVLYCVLAVNLKEAKAVEYDIFAILFNFILSWVVWRLLVQGRAIAYFDKQQLIKASRIDWLTGVVNKENFEKQCGDIYSSGSSIKRNAFVMLDVDDFKQINDKYGHETGDRVLQCISQCIKTSLAPNDIVGRVGGDEFAILILNIEDEEQLRHIFKRITDRIAQISSDVVDAGVNVSIGCLLLPAAPLVYKKYYIGADKLLYEAKSEGKNKAIISEYNESDCTEENP